MLPPLVREKDRNYKVVPHSSKPSLLPEETGWWKKERKAKFSLIHQWKNVLSKKTGIHNKISNEGWDKRMENGKGIGNREKTPARKGRKGSKELKPVVAVSISASDVD